MNPLSFFSNTTLDALLTRAPGFPSGRQIPTRTFGFTSDRQILVFGLTLVIVGLTLVIRGLALRRVANQAERETTSLRSLRNRVIDNPNNHPLHAEATAAAIRGMQHTDIRVCSAALSLFRYIVGNEYTPSYIPAFKAAQQAQVHGDSFIEEQTGLIFAQLALCKYTPAYSDALEFVKKYRNCTDPISPRLAYETLAWLVEQQYPDSYPAAIDFIREAQINNASQAMSICKTLVSRRYIPLYPTARSLATQCIDHKDPQWRALGRDIFKELLLKGDEESYSLALPITEQAIQSTNEDEQNWAKTVRTLIACQPTILTLERTRAAAAAYSSDDASQAGRSLVAEQTAEMPSLSPSAAPTVVRRREGKTQDADSTRAALS